MIHVFTYGTLKPGEINHQVCAADVVEAQPAIAIGRLYHLPFDYPAMTLEPDDIVQGYLLTFTSPEVLIRLDEFEQHDPEAFQRVAPGQCFAANQYQRQWLPILTPQRQPLVSAWGYVMTPEQISRLNGKLVPIGNWQGQGKGFKA